MLILDSSSRREVMIRTTLLFALGVCCTLGFSRVNSQEPTARSAAWDQKAAATYLDDRAIWWKNWSVSDRDHDTSCASCHTTVPYALARPALRAALGETTLTFPETELQDDVSTRVALWNETNPYYPDQRFGLPKSSESRGTESILNALVLSSRDAREGHLNAETKKAFENLWKLQFTRGDGTGAWAWLYFDLAPWESEGAAYFGAALAAIAVGIAPDQYASSTEIEGQLASLREYLLENYADRSPFDRVMLLWASSELSGLLTEEQSRLIADGILHLQNNDGGWSLTSLGSWDREDGYRPAPGSDAYATGLIAFALQKSGVSPSEKNLGKALDWLVKNQNPTEGYWPASSLNKEHEPTSERGFMLTAAATAFAVLALTYADPSVD